MNPGGNALTGPTGLLVQFAPFGLILVLFYFLLIRPQQEKARQTQEMLDGLKVNDEVVTTGGLHGRIVKLGDKTLFVEIAPKIQVRIDRPAVIAVAGKPRPGERPAEKASEEKSA